MDEDVIVGGGIIGAATAYFLSKEDRKVKVIERDPTYKKASFPLSLGGFRRQFFQKENILLGKFAREFINQIPELLKTEKNPKPTASMVPNGYLLMFGPEHAEEQYKALENHKACEAGTKNIKGSELKQVFPYINSEGIETATYTDNRTEGWIDPFMFHGALKSKAMELGAQFVKGEVKSLSEIKAKTIISAAGCWTKELLEDNGMPTITWKPLENEQIPKEARGLIIPGGFPEQHAHQLSNSRISLNSIKIFSKKFPIYAECGGMMLLGESIFDIEGREYSMAGILPFKAKKGNLKIGYREATSKNKSPITTPGNKLIGHEFHRWEIFNESYNSNINCLWDIKGWNLESKNEGFCNHLIHASWVHLHWASSPLILENWKRSVMNKV